MSTWLTNFAIYYLAVGYVVNNIIGLMAIYGSGGRMGVDIGAFILTIPTWPYTLYQAIGGLFGEE